MGAYGIINRILTPVSYTHLDVYKRQVYEHPHRQKKLSDKLSFRPPQLINNSEAGNHKSNEIGYRKTKENTIYSKKFRKNKQKREQENKLPAEREENGYFHFAYRLKKVADNDLCSGKGKHGKSYA